MQGFFDSTNVQLPLLMQEKPLINKNESTGQFTERRKSKIKLLKEENRHSSQAQMVTIGLQESMKRLSETRFNQTARSMVWDPHSKEKGSALLSPKETKT